LNAIEGLSVADQFRIVTTSMELLFQMQLAERLGDLISRIAVGSLPSGYILSTYVVMSSFAMRIPAFADLCSDAENRSWLKLESVILSMLNKDTVFLQAFINFEETFAELAKRDIQQNGR
jgi:hypothetical protein